ncbi:DUF1707 domain-containing protein [Actinopolymorpha sp. B17G11]|uniref:DUF1707 SHOCT-like domain-containing protein n=1 Tax=Actinopolymorpha sp. B17G11 TaxID=3160861 RepID=UPI0032E4CEE4
MTQLPEPTDPKGRVEPTASAGHVEPTEPNGPRDVRASDADRHQVAERLRDAAGDGRLTLDELDQRLEGVYAARTYAELDRFTHDLPAVDPATGLAARPEPAAAPAYRGTLPGQAVSIAFMSGVNRRGSWVVPHAHTAVAFWGGVNLDLRNARFTQPEVTIRAFAIMGGIEVIVPEDVDVIVDGVGIMGGFDDSSDVVEPDSGGSEDDRRPALPHTGHGSHVGAASHGSHSHAEPGQDGAENADRGHATGGTVAPRTSRPVVRVTGLAFWGGVNVKRKARPSR